MNLEVNAFVRAPSVTFISGTEIEPVHTNTASPYLVNPVNPVDL
jgi:hypothetical protein